MDKDWGILLKKIGKMPQYADNLTNSKKVKKSVDKRPKLWYHNKRSAGHETRKPLGQKKMAV